MVSSRLFGSSAVSLACISAMCSVQCFPGGHSLRLAFGSFFYRRILAGVWPWLFAWLFSSAISWFESSTTAFLRFFPLRRIDCGFAFTCLAVKRLTNLAIKRSNELSGLAVHELSESSGSRAQQLSGSQAQ